MLWNCFYSCVYFCLKRLLHTHIHTHTYSCLHVHACTYALLKIFINQYIFSWVSLQVFCSAAALYVSFSKLFFSVFLFVPLIFPPSTISPSIYSLHVYLFFHTFSLSLIMSASFVPLNPHPSWSPSLSNLKKSISVERLFSTSVPTLASTIWCQRCCYIHLKAPMGQKKCG